MSQSDSHSSLPSADPGMPPKPKRGDKMVIIRTTQTERWMCTGKVVKCSAKSFDVTSPTGNRPWRFSLSADARGSYQRLGEYTVNFARTLCQHYVPERHDEQLADSKQAVTAIAQRVASSA